MKHFYLLLCALGIVDREAFERSSKGTQLAVTMGCIGTILAPITLAVVIGSCIGIPAGSWLLGILVGVGVGILFFTHERSLMEPVTKLRLVLRFNFGILAALMLAIPVKVGLLQSFYKKEVVTTTASNNAQLYDEKVGKLEEEYNDELDTIEDSIIIFGEKDINGRIKQKQKLEDARRKLAQIKERYPALISEAKTRVQNLYMEPDTSIQGLISFAIRQTFKGQTSTVQNVYSILFFIVLILLEDGAVIAAAFLYNTSYMQELRNREERKKHAINIQKLAQDKMIALDLEIFQSGDLSKVKNNLQMRKLYQAYALLAGSSTNNQRSMLSEEELLKQLEKANLLPGSESTTNIPSKNGKNSQKMNSDDIDSNAPFENFLDTDAEYNYHS